MDEIYAELTEISDELTKLENAHNQIARLRERCDAIGITHPPALDTITTKLDARKSEMAARIEKAR